MNAAPKLQLQSSVNDAQNEPERYNVFGSNFNSNIRHLFNLNSVSSSIDIMEAYLLKFNCGYLEYNSGLLLAISPSDHNHKWVCYSKCKSNLIDRLIGEFADYFIWHGLGKQLRKKAYLSIFDSLLANLLYSDKKHCQLLVSRETAKVTKAFVYVCDFLLSSGYAIGVIGQNNSYQEARSWMIPSTKLLTLAKREEIKIRLAKNYSMIVVRDSAKKEIKPKLTRTDDQRAFNRMQRPVQILNEMLLDHVVSLPDGREFNCFCHRVFSESRLDLGGRFYGGDHLSLHKTERKQLLIDGVVTIEPDFKSMHVAILYALKGIQLKDDPYIIDGFDRKAVKLALLIMVNASRLQDVKKAVTFSAKPENIALHKTYKEARKQYDEALKQHTFDLIRGRKTERPAEPEKPFNIYERRNGVWRVKCEKLFIAGMPEGTDGKALIEAILARHEPIADLFGSEHLGLKLQFIDSEIMASVITQLAAVNVPALPIHDSVKVKATDCQAAVNAMQLAYKSITGFDAVIDY